MRGLTRAAALALVAVLGVSACSTDPETTAGTAVAATDQQIEVVAPATAAELLESAPEGLVVLDVRTPEEFAAGHLPGATNIDFYADDFREQLGSLDREVPYLLYCQSGNRSGQARAMMADLGFTSVTDVDGGIIAWQSAGLPLDG